MDLKNLTEKELRILEAKILNERLKKSDERQKEILTERQAERSVEVVAIKIFEDKDNLAVLEQRGYTVKYNTEICFYFRNAKGSVRHGRPLKFNLGSFKRTNGIFDSYERKAFKSYYKEYFPEKSMQYNDEMKVLLEIAEAGGQLENLFDFIPNWKYLEPEWRKELVENFDLLEAYFKSPSMFEVLKKTGEWVPAGDIVKYIDKWSLLAGHRRSFGDREISEKKIKENNLAEKMLKKPKNIQNITCLSKDALVYFLEWQNLLENGNASYVRRLNNFVDFVGVGEETMQKNERFADLMKISIEHVALFNSSTFSRNEIELFYELAPEYFALDKKKWNDFLHYASTCEVREGMQLAELFHWLVETRDVVSKLPEEHAIKQEATLYPRNIKLLHDRAVKVITMLKGSEELKENFSHNVEKAKRLDNNLFQVIKTDDSLQGYAKYFHNCIWSNYRKRVSEGQGFMVALQSVEEIASERRLEIIDNKGAKQIASVYGNEPVCVWVTISGKDENEVLTLDDHLHKFNERVKSNKTKRLIWVWCILNKIFCNHRLDPRDLFDLPEECVGLSVKDCIPFVKQTQEYKDIRKALKRNVIGDSEATKKKKEMLIKEKEEKMKNIDIIKVAPNA